MSNIPMQGLAKWLRLSSVTRSKADTETLLRWANEVESASARLAEAAIAQPVALDPAIEGRLSLWLTLGKELNPHTVNLVVRFARALSAKLADAEKKYGYSDGWASPDWMDECRVKLLEHIEKGDPRDVAAYCAFLWHHGESTKPHPAPKGEDAASALHDNVAVVTVQSPHTTGTDNPIDFPAGVKGPEHG